MLVEPIQRPEKLKDAAYSELKRLLISGQLKSGELYSAGQFAEILHVSRTPVREALLQLSHEGFLEAVDGRGYRLREFSPTEISEFFETRQLIECYVVEHAVGHLNHEDIKTLEGFVASMEKLAEDGKAQEFLEADREFHLYLVRRHANSQLQEVMNKIRDLICMLGHKAVADRQRMDEVVMEHRNLLDALKQKDRILATRMMASHLDATRKKLLAGAIS